MTLLTPQAIKILEERYLLRDSKGILIETPDEMFWRVAKAVASAESVENYDFYLETFFEMMSSLDFLPNSPTLANAGCRSHQLSACFVLPIEDSLDGIFSTLHQAALIHKTGGGTGFSFGKLRGKGSRVASTGHEASGPVSFLRVFDAATNSIKQGGMRRGANMAILPVDHPDIQEFIHSKDDGKSIENFNISVAIPNWWMNCLIAHRNDPSLCEKACVICERFEEITESAWKTGDPGLWFIDSTNDSKANPVRSLGPIESTNPCGEQPLYAWDVCTLGSINLGNFVIPRNPKYDFDREDLPTVDWGRLRTVVHNAVRLLDNVVEVNEYPLPQIEKMAKSIRRIGLGVMGWADMLVKINMAYDSQEAVDLGREVMRFISKEADKASLDLGEERGCFPLWTDSIYYPEKPFRNCTRTTIAPTGTISLIAGCSSGIEPIFALSMQTFALEGKLRELPLVYRPFTEYLQEYKRPIPATQPEELLDQVAQLGTAQFLNLPNKEIFKIANEISWRSHVDMQSVFQEFTDNAVSKTINLPNEATVKDVAEAYVYAYQQECDGITIFRNGCRESQVLVNTGSSKAPLVISKQKFEKPQIRKSVTIDERSPFGTVHLHITTLEDQPYEIYITVGKSGSDVTAMTEAIGRLASKVLDPEIVGLTGVEKLDIIAQQLRYIGGSSMELGVAMSLPDAIGKALEKYYFEIPAVEKVHNTGGLCIQCGNGSLVRNEGCITCRSCGWSRC